VQAVPPAVVEGTEQQLEAAVGSGGAWLRPLALEDGELLAQGQVFEDVAPQ